MDRSGQVLVGKRAAACYDCQEVANNHANFVGAPDCGPWGAHHLYYPTDHAGRQRLADELTATGLKPTQTKQSFDRDKINRMVEAMKDGSFAWNRASFQPVILGPNDEVMGGHHRVIAAYLAGIDLTAMPGPRPQIQRLPKNFRPVSDWIDVLPDVP
jgi:ParB-like nuclease domain